MSLKTIAFLYPGSMGSSLAHTLSIRQPHLTLLTSLSSRSQSTRDRATASGLQDVPLSELVARSDVVVSILPPSSAISLAQEIIDALPPKKDDRRARRPIFVDANAVSPGTMSAISAILTPHGIPLIDGCVIGGPAKEGYDPTVYLASGEAYLDELKAVADVLSGGEDGKGMKIRVMDGAREGDASALKMCYGGISKGTTGLAAVLLMAANAHSHATADALLHELSLSNSSALQRFSGSLPSMVPKAYRWVGEMEEIASFITTSLSPLSSKKDGDDVAQTYLGMAKVYQRITDDLVLKAEAAKRGGGVKGEEVVGNGKGTKRGREKEVDELVQWAEKGKRVLASEE